MDNCGSLSVQTAANGFVIGQDFKKVILDKEVVQDPLAVQICATDCSRFQYVFRGISPVTRVLWG